MSINASSSRISACSAAVLALVAVLLPWALGGVDPNIRLLMALGVAVSLVVYVFGLLLNRALPVVIPLAVLPLVLGAGLAVFQVLPLDTSLVQRLSPQVLLLRQELLPQSVAAESPLAAVGETTGAQGEDPSRATISLYAPATRKDLATLTCLTVVFLLAAQLFSHDRGLIRLCKILTINAVFLAFFGIVHRVSGSPYVYWLIPHAGAPFGPFVNHNNAGGFLNISLGPALLLLVATFEAGGAELPAARDFFKNPASWLNQLSRIDPRRLWAFAGVCCISAGLICALSRGSILAWCVAGLGTLFAVPVFRHRSQVLQVCVFAVAITAAVVAWSGQLDAFQSRMSTISNLDDERLDIWSDLQEAIPQFGMCGSGIGTFRYLSPLYQERLMVHRYLHAENQYVEALIEGGWLGLSLMLAAIVLVGYAVWKLQRFGGDQLSRAAAFGGLFALGSQVFGAALDFGLYTPANALTLALFCGALTGRAARVAPLGAKGWLYGFRPHWLGGSLAFAILAWGMYWSLGETRRVTGATVALEWYPRDPSTIVDLADLDSALGMSDRARELRPEDADVEARIAELMIGTYRNQMFVQLVKEFVPDFGEPPAEDIADRPERSDVEDARSPQADDVSEDSTDDSVEEEQADPTVRELWERTSPSILHQKAWEAWFDGDADALQRLRSEPLVARYLKPAVDHLVRARQLCPELPLVHYRLAELAFLAGDPPGDEAHLKRAIRIDAGNAEIQFGGGLLDFQARRDAAACAKWRRCIELTPQYRDEIIAYARQRMSFQMVATQVLPQDSRTLMQMALLFSQKQPRPETAVLATRADELLESSTEPEAERYFLEGVIASLRNDIDRAITQMGTAVERAPRQIEWRFQLALFLWKKQELKLAEEQLETCVAMDRSRIDYRNALQQLRHEILVPPDRASEESFEE